MQSRKALYLVTKVASVSDGGCFLLEEFMRTVNIDLSKDTTESREKIYVGYTGEHNATELIVQIPQAMAKESNYLVAVFLTGDKIVRSGKITTDKSLGAPYLEGNNVHIRLSQKLTGNTSLGIQIEGYAKDENGISVLVGKSAYISNLTFRLSPKGSSDDSVMPDYEEIIGMLRKASESENGDGIKKYETFDFLPTDAEEGDIAFVKTASGAVITESFEFSKKYARFIPKREINRDFLKLLPSDEEDYPAVMSAEFKTSSKGNILCYCSFIYYEPIGSIFALSGFSHKDDLYDYGVPDNYYIYIGGEGDMAPIFDLEEPLNVMPGWYTFSEKYGEWYIENGSPTRDTSIEFEPFDFDSVSDFKILKNCIVKYDDPDEYESDPLMANMFAGCFDIYSESFHEKGLYMYKEGAWEQLSIQKNVSVSSRAELCFAAEDGQTAVVTENTTMFISGITYLYENMQLKSLYINPKPPEYMWLTDCHIKAQLEYTSTSSGKTVTTTEESKGFELVSDKNRRFVFIGLSASPYDLVMRYYLYTEEAGDVSIPSGTFGKDTVTVIKNAPKGWCRVTEDNGTYTLKAIQDYSELPKVLLSNYSSLNFYFKITVLESELTSQSFIGQSAFYSMDSTKGLWYFSGGQWIKVGDSNA